MVSISVLFWASCTQEKPREASSNVTQFIRLREEEGKNKYQATNLFLMFVSYFIEFTWGVPNLHKWRVRRSLLGVVFQPFLQTLLANHACKVCEGDRQPSVSFCLTSITLLVPLPGTGGVYSLEVSLSLSQMLRIWSLGVPTCLH